MAVVDSATLKSYFNTCDVPTEAQFCDLIDTLFSMSAAPGGGGTDDLGDTVTDVSGWVINSSASATMLRKDLIGPHRVELYGVYGENDQRYVSRAANDTAMRNAIASQNHLIFGRDKYLFSSTWGVSGGVVIEGAGHINHDGSTTQYGCFWNTATTVAAIDVDIPDAGPTDWDQYGTNIRDLAIVNEVSSLADFGIRMRVGALLQSVYIYGFNSDNLYMDGTGGFILNAVIQNLVLEDAGRYNLHMHDLICNSTIQGVLGNGAGSYGLYCNLFDDNSSSVTMDEVYMASNTGHNFYFQRGFNIYARTLSSQSPLGAGVSADAYIATSVFSSEIGLVLQSQGINDDSPFSTKVYRENKELTGGFITAAGSSQSSATPIRHGYVVVNTVVASATQGVQLPVAATGAEVSIFNNGAASLQVYPAGNNNINQEANGVPVALAAATGVTFKSIDNDRWYQVG